MASVVALRYAQALFSLAVEMDKLDVIKKDLHYIVQVMEDNTDLILILKNPSVEKTDAKNILSNIFCGVDLYTNNFLMVLVERNRFQYIEDISSAYLHMYNAHNNIEVAQVCSASELSEDECQRIKAMLEKRFSKKIELEFTIDKELLAGIRIQVAGELLDNSIQNQFVKMKEQITKNVIL